jgi:phage-related minor tail protein
MANNLKGLTIEIGGDTKGLSDALKNVNGDISNLQSNLRTVNSALKLDPDNVEAVAMKQELLTQAVDATRQKLETLKEAQRQADEQMANGIEVDQRAYQSLRAEIVRTSSSLSEYESQIEDTGQAAEDAAAEFEEMWDSASEGVDRMSTGFGNITGAATSVVTAVTGAFAAVSGALLYASESTVEYRTNLAKLETAFTTAGHTAETASQTYTNFYGFLGDEGQATEAAQHLAQLTNDQKALAEWTTIATGVYATFGDSLPIEGLMEAANETAKTGALTGGLADALNWAGINEEQFQAKLDATTSSQEREALIRETLNGIYTDAGEKYKENAADLIASNEAQARYTDAMAVFGEKAQPILNAVREGFALLIERASAFLTEVDMDAITAAIENAFAWFLNTAVPAIQSAIQWVIDHKDIILAAISAIGAGFVAWNVVQIVSGAIQAFTSFKSAIGLVKTAFSALNVVMKANVIGIIVTAVAALVAGFIYLWNNCEGFRNFWLNMWEGIKNAFNATVEWFKKAAASIAEFFSNAWTSIKNAWSAVTGFFSGIWTGIKNVFSSVGSWFGNIFKNAWTAITGAFSSVTSFFSGIWTKIKSAFSNAVSGMASIGKDIIRGLWNGINDMVGWITGKIQSFGENVLGGIKKFFGIKSPSTVMRDQVGRDLARGVGVGIEQNADEALDPMDDLVSEMTGVNIDRNISNTFRNTSVNEFGGLSERLDAVLEYLSRYLPEVAENASQGIYLDGDTLVGTLGGRFDAELAKQYVKKGRGQ